MCAWVRACVRARERERERDIQTYIYTDIQTDRQRNRDRAPYRRCTCKECVKLWPVNFTLNGLVHTTATTDASASTEKLPGVPCGIVLRRMGVAR